MIEKTTEIEAARRLAKILDSSLPVPGTKHTFGIDALLGLIPGLGDTLGTVLSTYILYTAAKAGVPVTGLVRMVGNITLDQIIGTVPILGDIFDFAFKSNVRNIAVIERALTHHSSLVPRTNAQIYKLVIAMFLFLVGVLALSVGVTTILILRLLS